MLVKFATNAFLVSLVWTTCTSTFWRTWSSFGFNTSTCFAEQSFKLELSILVDTNACTAIKFMCLLVRKTRTFSASLFLAVERVTRSADEEFSSYGELAVA